MLELYASRSLFLSIWDKQAKHNMGFLALHLSKVLL